MRLVWWKIGCCKEVLCCNQSQLYAFFSSWIYLKHDPNPMEFQASVKSICLETQLVLYTSYNCLLFRDILWCCSLISVVYCMILKYCVCGCLCGYLHMFGVWVCIGAARIPGLMHIGPLTPLLNAACFPRLLVALGSHGTVIYNKEFLAHTLGRGNAPT